jgi:hypothetical protein
MNSKESPVQKMKTGPPKNGVTVILLSYHVKSLEDKNSVIRCLFIGWGRFFIMEGFEYAMKDFTGSISIDQAWCTKRIASEAGLHSRFPCQINEQTGEIPGSGQ